MQNLAFGDVVSIGASAAFAKTPSEDSIHKRPLTASRKMPRFDSDQMHFTFSPQGPSYYRPPARAPYSHIQVVQKPESVRQGEHASQQVTFRKPSYSKEAEQLATRYGLHAEDRQGQSVMAAAASAPLPPKPTASLANMTSGTTFAAKARAAELNAVRARRAMKDPNEEDDTTMPTAMSGPVKLNKPRSRGRGGWKPLNLDEIPEATTEADQLGFHNQPSSASIVAGSDSEQHTYPEVRPSRYLSGARLIQGQAPRFPQDLRPYSSDMATQHNYLNQEHIRHQMNQLNQLNLQRQMPQYAASGAPTVTAQYQAPLRGSPGSPLQERKSTDDDPFTDLPKTVYRLPVHASEYQPQQVTDVPGRFNATTPPTVGGTMDYDFRFPIEHQERRNIPQPPGLPILSSISTESSFKSKSMTTGRQLAPTADTHQRDPKPYTNFTRSSVDSSNRERLLRSLQQVSDQSKAQGDLVSSTRTVLYDPVAQDVRASTAAHGPAVSQSGEDILKTSEPLPWKNRPVDIYNVVPPTLAAPRFMGGEQAVAAIGADIELGGKAYVQSITAQPSSAEQRQEDTEAWWYRDGRGQHQIRTWLEKVAEEHRKKMTSQEYERMKKSLERQASFRDDRSNCSDITTVPEAANAGDAFNRLIGPVLANLYSYGEERGTACFDKFTQAPAWAVDGGSEGNKSFFEETWGKPPSRVGRDRRYRPTFHEGRYTVFEPTDGRVSGRGW